MEKQLINKNQIITRTMYCERCAANRMPRIGNIMALFGGTSQRYRPVTIKKEAPVREYGFTPHLIYVPQLDWVDEQECVSFEKSCAMNGCGVEIMFDPFTNRFDVSFREREPVWMSISNYTNLMNFKDINFYSHYDLA
jgi:hypothetical protein